MSSFPRGSPLISEAGKWYIATEKTSYRPVGTEIWYSRKNSNGPVLGIVVLATINHVLVLFVIESVIDVRKYRLERRMA